MNKFIVLFSFLILFLSGCKPVRKISADPNQKEYNKIIKKFEGKDIKYVWLKVKADIKYNTPDASQKATLHLFLHKDSLIWGSVTAVLGVEIFRFFMTADSFTLIDKMSKRYYSLPLAVIYNSFNIKKFSFSTIENLIFGQNIFSSTESWILQKDQEKEYLYHSDEDMQGKIFINPDDKKISGYEFSKPLTGQKVLLTYKDNMKVNGYTIPKIVDIKYFTPGEISLVLNFVSIQFEKSVQINTAIPNTYERME
jgi:hypothetical protein